MVSNPSDLHFAQCHRIAECISKDEDERTFLRPDHLRQHVKNFHKERLNETIRDLWRREGPSSNAVENWVCGFCAKELKTWQDRQTHIAGHFKDGLTMTDWKGYMRQDTEAEASKKRPTSSEGRPNMLSKLARTLTGRSVHQQLHCMSRNQIADVFDTTQPFTGTRCPDLRLLPELIFDDFMLGGDDGYLDYSDMTLTSAYEQDSVSAERHDSAFPDGVNAGFNFGNLVEGSTNEDSSSLNTFGLWNE
ncbi:hypothetical protein G6011_08920 [Alternaria panax]|uniref:C2H2-type domain-containing protein n=1 Tax=Alternaria panax TaxID=48097 RepID=A0AAD4IAA6_9PLEO|nr:hypothetical protein G6011_08920 [Alternaria panax]